MALSHAAATRARPKDRAYRLADELGLYLDVRPGGMKRWRMRFRDERGKEQLLTFGLFPAEGIEAARARRDIARAAIAAGDDPRDVQIRALEAAARAWHAHRAPAWSPEHAADVLRSLERDIFPAIGAMPLEAVDRPTVDALLGAIEARGAIETARRVQQRIKVLFAFARAKGWTDAENPAVDAADARANAPRKGRQPALLDVGEIRALLVTVGQLRGARLTKLAGQFLALTGVRLAALRGMRWDEVTELDGPAPLWRVPAARLKLKAVNKTDATRDHLVPLAPAAVAALVEARELAGADGLVWRGRGGEGAIGADALNQLYARAGYSGRHCAHGWRASFSTIMNLRRREERAAIDAALAHVLKGVSDNEGAYNRGQDLDLRRELLAEWAALISPATPAVAA